MAEPTPKQKRSFPLPVFVEFLRKAGVDEYDKEVLERLNTYMLRFLGKKKTDFVLIVR
jgi:hypothetical protein